MPAVLSARVSRFVVVSGVAFSLVSFAVSASAITLDWVTVGDPGNAADTTGYGHVATTFRIMKYEFTNQQYADFLNSVAATDTYSLYNSSMDSDARGGITQSGTSGSYTYTVKPSMGDKPVNYVDWFAAARVTNWLHNGATDTASTETGAYTLSGGTTGNAPALNPGALYALPSENQWYKAAYYKGARANAGYWKYATQSDTAPVAVTADFAGNGSAGGVGNYANFVFVAEWGGVVGNATTVGSNGRASTFGAFDMSGNFYEWNDLTGDAGVVRGLRGGGVVNSDYYLSSSYRDTIGTLNEIANFGFRLVETVAVPEPSTCMMALAGLACGGYALFCRRCAR
jgi:sulfatase modifying factor 1